MAKKSSEGQLTPPYVSYKTFKTFVRSIGSAIPSRIDKHVMPTFSGANQSQTIHALKYLRLIDQLGVPTDKLERLASATNDEYLEAIFDIFDGAYPFMRDGESFDLTSATDGMLNEEFSKLAQGDTIRKCKSFFLAALKDAGASISPYIKEPGKRGPSKGAKRRGRPPKKVKGKSGDDKTPDVPPPEIAGIHPALSGMLKELPKTGTAWPKDRKDLFVSAFRGILDVVYPDAD